jgi:gliding motility-associated-like protein
MTQTTFSENKKGIYLIPLFTLLITWANAQVWNIGSEYFIQGSAVEVGVGGAGGYEGADVVSTIAPVQPAGMHFSSNNPYFGFVANPDLDGWTDIHGDFFTTGAPENGWGVEIGGTSGTKLSNNCMGELDIPGSVVSTYDINGCLSVIWEGASAAGANLEYVVEYQMNENDLYYTTKIKIRNIGATPANDIYYYRNVDPDNIAFESGDYSTTNLNEDQPDGICGKAHVSAKTNLPNDTYLGFAGIDPNFRVGWGGFSNRDASDMYFGGAGLNVTEGASTVCDCAIFITYYINSIAPGDSAEFKFVVILDAAQAESAINSLFYFNYSGGIGAPPAVCSYSVDTVPSCPGKTVNIELIGTNLGDFTWTWSPNTYLDVDTGLVVNASPTTDITYTITGVPTNPCFTIPVSQSIVVVMDQTSDIEFDIVTSNPNCLNNDGSVEVIITGGIGPVTVSWTGGPTTPLWDNLFAGIYEVTLTDSFGCYADTLAYLSNVTTLTANVVIDSMALCNYPSGMFTISGVLGDPAYTYALGTDTSATGVFSGLSDSTYVVAVSDEDGCLIFVPVVIVDTSLINISASIIDEICDGVNGSAIVGGTYIGSPATYTLGTTTQSSPSFTGLASGTYSVIVNDVYGCADTTTFTIGDSSNFDASFVSQINDECDASIGQVVVAGSNGVTPYSYSILPASSTSTTGTFNGLGSGSYVVTVSTPGGACTDTVQVTIVDLPSTLAATLGNVTDENCGIHNGIFDINATGGYSPYVYDIGGPSQTSNTFTGLNNGGYIATVTDSLGCTVTVPVTVGEIPIDIDLGPDVIYCNEYTIPGDGAGNYLWSNGATTQNLTVTASGEYWLTVSTPECFDVDTIEIELVDIPEIIVPNVFTPNGDGSNDKFEIQGMFITSYRMNIYNRWGQLMFTTESLTNMWDGKQDGTDVAEGVYMYIIEYINPCEVPAEQTRNGAVQLFR